MKLRLGLALSVLALGVAFALTGCGGGSVANDGIVIGEYGSLTGDAATFGQSTQMGVQSQRESSSMSAAL